MATELELFTPRDVDTIKTVLAPGVSDDELALFAKVCAGLGLSPFRDEVALVGRHSKDAGRKVYKHQVTVHGRRVLAQRTGELRGIVGPEWCGPHTPNPDSPLRWVDVWLEDGPPHTARVTVYRAGWEAPTTGTVPWREFAQRNRDGGLTGLWPNMPAHMLGKVAEALALRRAFPEVITEAVATEFDDYDADEASGGATGAEEVATTRSPPRHAPAPMDAAQVDVIRRLVGRLGMDRPALLAHISGVLGRPVESTLTLTHDEAATIITDLAETAATFIAAPDVVVEVDPERPLEAPETDATPEEPY